MSLQEYIVTLHNKEDLDDFYEDMETPGGSLYIPNRAVNVANKRPISRNTHYLLTQEEVELLINDDRVWDVQAKAIIDAVKIKPSGYFIDGGEFDRNFFTDASDENWGILRHIERENRSGWGSDNTSLQTEDVKITSSGKNVDVLIVDGHMDPAHPEFAINSDGTGGSRVQQFNWFSLNPEVTGGSAGTYVYPPYVDGGDAVRTADNNHGAHVAGTAAGNTKGWARDSEIYCISPYATNPNDLDGQMWDYIRAWHSSKPINPDTGRPNPTISNHSYGSVIQAGSVGSPFGNIQRIRYRGVDFNPGRDLTQAELQARGCYAPSGDGAVQFPFYSTSGAADIQDAMNDGIIVVVSAGNESWKIVSPTDQDYGNLAYLEYLGSTFGFYYNRGGMQSAKTQTISVGAVDLRSDDRKATYSNCGNLVDIFAAGTGINSSFQTGGAQDPRNNSYTIGKFQGTSMSAPQVTGVLALLAEHWPGMSQLKATEWLLDNSTTDEMADSEADDAMDLTSLQDGPNKMLYWKNIRPVEGNVYPRSNIGVTRKVKWPRPKIKRNG